MNPYTVVNKLGRNLLANPVVITDWPLADSPEMRMTFRVGVKGYLLIMGNVTNIETYKRWMDCYSDNILTSSIF